MSRVIGVTRRSSQPQRTYPMLCNADFTAPIRHLLFHMMPLADGQEWCWKKHVRQICEGIKQFNGQKIITIATPGPRDTIRYSCPDDVVKEFDKYGSFDINFLILQNKRTLREVVSFVPMLTKVQSTDPQQAVFYGHCKGITHPADSMCHVWSDAMYETVYNNWPQVQIALERYGIAGSFKSYGQFNTRGNHRWHYSGTFFWFRSASVFVRNWSKVDGSFYGVESWPGLLFRPHEAACLFWDIPHTVPIGPMYKMPRSEHDARISKWRHEKLAGKLPFNLHPDQYLFQLQQQGVPSNF